MIFMFTGVLYFIWNGTLSSLWKIKNLSILYIYSNNLIIAFKNRKIR